jgi:class 3 adenylate cyclase
VPFWPLEHVCGAENSVPLQIVLRPGLRAQGLQSARDPASKERDTSGDGIFATFDGPARAIRCAQAIVESVRQLGIGVRVGVHTGECEIHERKVVGLAVNVGAVMTA